MRTGACVSGKDQAVKVGLDLAPAAMADRAPGTARLCFELAKALFEEPVPWRWVPVFSRDDNPLRDLASPFNPRTGSFRSIALHASFETGRLWRSGGCQLGYSMAYFSPFYGPPVVANFFDANFYEQVDGWHRQSHRLRHNMTGALFQHTLNRARKLFILSGHGKERMTALFPRTKDKWVVSRCGFTKPDSQQTGRPSWLTGLEKPYLLSAGALSDNKNQKTLLMAWKILQEKYADAPALVLTGPGDDNYVSQQIRPLLHQLPRPQDVIMPGRVSEASLGWAFEHALAYVQPSIAEGFCMPLIEAMACGLPVGCSSTTSLPETAGDAALFFNPHQAGEIVKIIETLWLDQATRNTLIARGHERAGQFSWKKSAEIVIQSICEVLQQQGFPVSTNSVPS